MQTNYLSRKLTAACGYLIVLVALTVLVKTDSSVLQMCDTAIQELFAPLTSTAMTHIVSMITTLGEPAASLALSILVIIGVYFAFSHSEAIWGFGVIIIGNGGAYIIKHLVARTRPLDKLVTETGYSFPSGHTFATAILVLLLLRLVVSRIKSDIARLWLSILLPLWVLVIMCTRIYLHVHYPSDTFASLLWAGCVWQAGLGIYGAMFGHLPGQQN